MIAQDSTRVDTTKSGLDLIFIGGLGMTAGSSFGFWSGDFKNGPVINIGAELPLSKSKIISLELLNYFWICYYNRGGEPSKNYFKINDKLFAQNVISPSLKLYILSSDNVVFPYLKLGYSLFLPVQQLQTIDGLTFGVGFNFKLFNQIFGLNYHWVVTGFNMGGSSGEFAPNVFMLNFHQNIKW